MSVLAHRLDSSIPPPRATDGEALLQAILDDPADDLPRLAWADWLEEQGQDDYAAFIRRQLSSDRAVTYWSPFPETQSALWLLEGVPDGPAIQARVRRGLVECVILSCEQFMQGAAALFARQPVTEVTLWDKVPGRINVPKFCATPPRFVAEGDEMVLQQPNTFTTIERFGWRSCGESSCSLPGALFTFLPDGPDGIKGVYATKEGARAELSAACVAWGRASRRRRAT